MQEHNKKKATEYVDKTEIIYNIKVWLGKQGWETELDKHDSIEQGEAIAIASEKCLEY